MSDLEPTSAPEPNENAMPSPANDAASAPEALPVPAASASAASRDWRSLLPSSFVLRPSSLPGLALDVFLIALIVIGVFFRFNWSNWNQDTDLHPDPAAHSRHAGRLFQHTPLGHEPVSEI